MHCVTSTKDKLSRDITNSDKQNTSNRMNLSFSRQFCSLSRDPSRSLDTWLLNGLGLSSNILTANQRLKSKIDSKIHRLTSKIEVKCFENAYRP